MTTDMTVAGIGASMARLSMPIRTIANWSKECAPVTTELPKPEAGTVFLKKRCWG
jgi:hypothetical protein